MKRLHASFRSVLLALLLPVPALGAGYELLEQSAQGLGQGFAGGATGSFTDGSAAFYNAAAMTRTRKQTHSFGVHLIAPHAEFEDENSRYVPQLGGGRVGGNEGGDGGEFAGVPNLYAVIPVGESSAFGMAINSPFGLSTEFNETWVGRYHAVRSELSVASFTPSFGMKVHDRVSIGLGIQGIWARAKISNAIDFASIAIASPAVPASVRSQLAPGQADGFGRVEGDDWGMGWTASALIEVSPTIDVGVSYRSPVQLDLRGGADFDVPAPLGFLTRGGAFVDTDVRAGVTLPEVASLGVSMKAGPDLSLYSDLTRIGWHKFEELRVEFESAQPDSVQPEEWDDTWRVSAGGAYDISKEVTLRAGAMFDETPVPNASLRTPRIPDNDRYWMTFGATYEWSEGRQIDASYAHIFVPDAKSTLVGSTGAILDGEWESSVDILSVSLTATF